MVPLRSFHGLAYKQKLPTYLTTQVNVINWIYKYSDSQVLLDIPILYTSVTKLSYAFQFKITSLNLTKQLHILIWNHESNLLDTLCQILLNITITWNTKYKQIVPNTHKVLMLWAGLTLCSQSSFYIFPRLKACAC